MSAALVNHLSTIPDHVVADAVRKLTPLPSRGHFIIFDGVDGSGKGTQVGFVEKLLLKMDIPCVLTKQPGGSAFGNKIREILFESIGTKNIDPDALEALFLSNHLHNCSLVNRYLREGIWVIADRWSPSAIAYMAERQADFRLQDLYRTFLERVKHDLFFLLTGDVEVLLARANARKTETHQTTKKWNNAEAMKKVDDSFRFHFGRDARTVMIDADKATAAAIFELQIVPELEERFGLKIPYSLVREVTA